MAEGLQTPDGKSVDVAPLDQAQREFSAAMAAPVADVPAPPDRPEKAEDKPKRRGRPPKAQRATAAPKAKTEPAPKDDYTDDARALVGGVWTVAAALGPTQPYALVIHGNADSLVSALAEGAKHNSTIRKFVSQGENTWMLQLASVGMTVAMQSLQLMGDKDLREQARAKTKAQLKEALQAQGIEVPEESPERAENADSPVPA